MLAEPQGHVSFYFNSEHLACSSWHRRSRSLHGAILLKHNRENTQLALQPPHAFIRARHLLGQLDLLAMQGVRCPIQVPGTSWAG